MGRWTTLLIGALYLGVQVGSLFHHHAPLPASCNACPTEELPAWECAEDDCHDSDHHHHSHDRHHQPHTCRICTAGEIAEVEFVASDELVHVTEVCVADPVRVIDAQPLAGHPTRAPPANGSFTV